MKFKNPEVDKYFKIQGATPNESGEVKIATRKYNVINLLDISLDQAVELYNEKAHYLAITDDGSKYIKNKIQTDSSESADKPAEPPKK